MPTGLTLRSGISGFSTFAVKRSAERDASSDVVAMGSEGDGVLDVLEEIMTAGSSDRDAMSRNVLDLPKYVVHRVPVSETERFDSSELEVVGGASVTLTGAGDSAKGVDDVGSGMASCKDADSASFRVCDDFFRLAVLLSLDSASSRASATRFIALAGSGGGNSTEGWSIRSCDRGTASLLEEAVRKSGIEPSIGANWGTDRVLFFGVRPNEPLNTLLEEMDRFGVAIEAP